MFGVRGGPQSGQIGVNVHHWLKNTVDCIVAIRFCIYFQPSAGNAFSIIQTERLIALEGQYWHTAPDSQYLVPNYLDVLEEDNSALVQSEVRTY